MKKDNQGSSEDFTMNGFGIDERCSREFRNRIKCCLIENKQRCNKPAENILLNKGLQKLVTNRKLNFIVDIKAGHTYVCDNHKTTIQGAKIKRNESDGYSNNSPKVDFSKLQLNTLRRCKRYLKLSSGSGMNKSQLVDAVTKHFGTIQINEKEVISSFFTKIKPNSNKLDHKNGYTKDPTKDMCSLFF